MSTPIWVLPGRTNSKDRFSQDVAQYLTGLSLSWLQNSRYLVSPPPRGQEVEDDTDSVDSEEDEPPSRHRKNSAFKRAVRKIITTRVCLQNYYSTGTCISLSGQVDFQLKGVSVLFDFYMENSVHLDSIGAVLSFDSDIVVIVSLPR